MRFRIEMQDGFARIGWLDEIRTPFLIDLRNEEIVNFFAKFSEKTINKEIEDLFFHSLDFLKKDGFVKKIILRGHYPKEFVENLLRKRQNFRYPLYIPLVASPQNLSLLLYMGADIIDNGYSLSKAHEGIYLTEVGEFELKKVKELPCNCNACYNREKYSSDYDFLADHNTFALQREMVLAVRMLELGRLRDLVETRVKSSPDLTAIMRLVDSKMDFSHYFPRFRKSKIFPTSEDSSNRFEIKYYFKRLSEIYEPRSHICLLLPCSAKKPYLTSKSHRMLRSKLGKEIKGVNEIIISSPFVSPRELELVYPISFYDTPTTGIWSEWEIESVASNLSVLIQKFEKIYAFLYGGYRKVAEKASDITGIEIEFFDDISRLKRKLESEEKEEFDLYVEIFKHMAKYQFDTVIEIDKVRGRYPNLEFYNKERVARIDMRFGNLDIYRDFALHLKDEGRYCVEIEEFDVKGTIFSGGVKRASIEIRPNDVVVFYNSETVGVGRALISGELMGKVDGKAIESRRKVISQE